MWVIIDYEDANITAVKTVFSSLSDDVKISHNSKEIREADLVILPDGNSYEIAMHFLAEYKLIDVLVQRNQADKPILGLGLGMQLFFEGLIIESDFVTGLNLLEGMSENILLQTGEVKLDNEKKELVIVGSESKWQQFSGEEVVFNNELVADCDDLTIIKAMSYHLTQFPAIIEAENIQGWQFKVEESSKLVKELLLLLIR